MNNYKKLIFFSLGTFVSSSAFADDQVFTPEVLLQVWGTAFDQDLDSQADPAGYGDPEDDPGFKIRRARIGGNGAFNNGLYYDIVFGAHSPYDVWGGSSTYIGLVDGVLGWKNDSFNVAVGQQKVPYSRENLISSGDLTFSERAVSTEHIVPSRETGLLGAYSVAGLKVSAGLFNGSGSFLGDNNIGFLSVGRLEYTIGDKDLAYSTWGKVENTVLAIGAGGIYNDDLSTSSLVAGGDILFRISGLAVLAEGSFESIKPTATDVAPSDVMEGTTRIGIMGQLGYTIGSFEPAVRASYFDDDNSVEDNGDLMELYGGITWHQAEDYGRVGIGYIHRQELGGRTYGNDTVRIWAQVKY